MPPPATTAEPTVPRVVVALSHPTMRRYVCDLVERGCRCWIATCAPEPGVLAATVLALDPDVLILEAASFPEASWEAVHDVRRVVVIGPVHDDAYRDAALAAGADAWLCRDHLRSALATELAGIVGGCGCGCSPGCGCGCGCHPDTKEVDQ